MESVRKERTVYRAKHIPFDNLYTKEELEELTREFGAAADENSCINAVNL